MAMFLPSSLSIKVLILVAIPLVFQLGFLGWMVYLQREAEQEVVRATNSKRISDAVNQLSSDCYEVISSFTGEQSVSFMPNSADQAERFTRLSQDFDLLDTVTKTDKRIWDQVQAARSELKKALEILLKIKQSIAR